MRQILGQHHASGITKNAAENLRFYTEVLGMRLVKKTVNQDDPSMYHLFFADQEGSPGTDITFFEIPQAGRTYRGSNSITQIALRVPSDAAIRYFESRLTDYNVQHAGAEVINERLTLEFEDFDGQRLALVSDEHQADKGGMPWEESLVPVEYGITGLGPFKMDVQDFDGFDHVLTDVFGYSSAGEYKHPKTNETIYKYYADAGGSGDELHVHKNLLPPERPGRGSMHHIALRVKDDAALHDWIDWLNDNDLPNSGFVDRHFFKSAYVRTKQGILIELATDGPGFAVNESVQTLGETLSLPPFLEDRRAEIESMIEPLPAVKKK